MQTTKIEITDPCSIEITHDAENFSVSMKRVPMQFEYTPKLDTNITKDTSKDAPKDAPKDTNEKKHIKEKIKKATKKATKKVEKQTEKRIKELDEHWKKEIEKKVEKNNQQESEWENERKSKSETEKKQVEDQVENQARKVTELNKQIADLTNEITSIKELLNAPIEEIPESPEYEPADSIIEDYYLEEAQKFGKGGYSGMRYSN